MTNNEINLKQDQINRKTNKSFAFRLDADTQIGTGHLMRCLSIANELFHHNSCCHFLCRELIPSLHALVVNHGHKVHHVDNDEDSALAMLTKLRPEWLIIDHYGLDAGFERKARAFTKRILVIDDLADRPHHCDFLLDQGPLRVPDDYRPWIDCKCQLWLGTDYALIRPEFRQLRKSNISSWRKGLICFGGADPDNVALAILQALDNQPRMRDIKWTVIAGSANPNLEALKYFTTHSRLNITLIKQSDHIAELMASHDFAIGAAGGMTWERACIGIPSLAIPISDKQVCGIEEIRHFGLGETLELYELTSATLAISLERLQHQANDYLHRNQAMVDGLGIARLSLTLLQLDEDPNLCLYRGNENLIADPLHQGGKTP